MKRRKGWRKRNGEGGWGEDRRRGGRERTKGEDEGRGRRERTKGEKRGGREVELEEWAICSTKLR